MINTIVQGDCLEVMKQIDDRSVDLTVTSPPYDNLRDYEGYTFDFEGIANELWRVTKDGGVVVWVVADATVNGSETLTSFKQALYFNQIGFNVHDTMIYKVNGTGAKGSNLSYWQAFEYMFVFSKGRPKTINRIADRQNKKESLRFRGGRRGNRYGESEDNRAKYKPKEFGVRTNIWTYSVGFADSSDRTDHPAPFPEDLAKDHIASWSSPGDLILDPMCGSGTTCKMAKVLNRNYIGIEISKKYIDIAIKRLNSPIQAMIGIE